MSDAHEAVLEHLFRHEAGRLVSGLVRALGPAHLSMAEDVVQDTLVRALERWRYGPLPDEPAAWLHRVAKNRALDLLRRQATSARYDAQAQASWRALERQVEACFADEVSDDVLRMMFSCCHPALSATSQVTLILNVLCGFSSAEIARCFLVSPKSLERRLSRAKATLRAHGLYEPRIDPELEARQQVVERAIYVLFSEGYHGSHPEHTVRLELIQEALRLGELLTTHPVLSTPRVYALMSLMCFQASRVLARQDPAGELLTLREQDRARWNKGLIASGFEHLSRSAKGDALSPLHIQAAIAAVHASSPSWEQTPWAQIVALYDQLVRLEPSPIARLNRAIACCYGGDATGALKALDALDAQELAQYPFFFAARAECHLELGQQEQALAAMQEAIAQSRNPRERRFWARRAALLKRQSL